MPLNFFSKLLGKKSKGRDKQVEKIQKKPRQYDEVELNIEKQNDSKSKEATKEAGLNYVEVDVKSSGTGPKIVGKEETKTQYSTIDIEATEKLSNQNKESS